MLGISRPRWFDIYTKIIVLPLICAGAILCAMLNACSGNAPLDGETRIRIDSTVTAQISKAKLEMDSFCTVYEKRELPKIIDSIKKIRLLDIEKQLKTIPK